MSELKKVSDFEWVIPKTGAMKVPGKIFANEKLLEGIGQDMTLKQIINVATLPGIIRESVAMPDAHQGYGFSIGGVAAFDMEKGIITPGGVGFDINCGVRILATDIPIEEMKKKVKEVLHDITRSVPSGVGRGHKEKLTVQVLDEVLKKGAKWAVEQGCGVKDDLERCEEYGCIENANPDYVSQRAKSRGLPQLGTLGSGNHFLEIQNVTDVFDEKIAKIFGIKKGRAVLMIHCGSRGLGHQVASDYIELMEKKYGHANLPDRELVNAPVNSELGKKYLSAMNCAVNFAFCNRQLITHYVREVLKSHFPNNKNSLVYDVCHNIAKIEEHIIEGVKKTVCVHRKGATRSFGPGRIEIPAVYREFGQPVIIPGSMGTASYLLVGTKRAEEIAFGSTAHGAGRVMSRTAALSDLRGEQVKKMLNDKGIDVEAGSMKGLAEEAPEVYKDIDEVIKVSEAVGLTRKVARLKPVAVMKG
jgi:tRNA-splicing ligase RtcB